MHSFLRYAIEKQGDIVKLTGDLAGVESPSGNAAAIRRLVDLLVESTRDIASVSFVRNTEYGPHLKLDFHLPGSKNEQRQLLALGHSDTVWPLGTLSHMPFRTEGERLYGPGVLDMKAGIAFFVFAARAVKELDLPVRRPVAMLIVADEEIGSPSSRAVTEQEARQSEAVLVLEPGTGLSGKLKTARKGIANYRMRVCGKASHAGVDFAAGASAINELASQILAASALTDLSRGVTVNAGVIHGGTRSNVVAAEAQAEFDVRATTLGDALVVEQSLFALKPVDSRCQLSISGGVNRPPMERTEAIAALFQKARTFAAEFGIELEESATGGGSDGNFTAALGIPTLDGLGAVGEGAHADHENILLNRVPDRVALLSALIANL